MMNSNYSKIFEYLYIGSNTILEDISNDIPIYFIVNCSVDIPLPKNAICPMQIRIPIENTLEDCLKFYNMIIYTKILEKIWRCIHEKKNVFVYGSNKLERPCTLIACLLIKYFRLTPKDSMSFIQNNCETFENNHFINTIRFYYSRCKQKNQKIEEAKNQKIEEKKTKY